jgi:hypothetical protein
MIQNRAKLAVVVLLLAGTLLFFAYQAAQWRRVFGVRDQRIVQILQSSDEQLTAKLIRRHAFLDLNFIIELNDKEIFTSPDFKPTNKIPFRETITWDNSGKNLIFEVAGERLFGYNLASNRALLDNQLLALEVHQTRPEDLHYSGKWPRRRVKGP